MFPFTRWVKESSKGCKVQQPEVIIFPSVLAICWFLSIFWFALTASRRPSLNMDSLPRQFYTGVAHYLNLLRPRRSTPSPKINILPQEIIDKIVSYVVDYEHHLQREDCGNWHNGLARRHRLTPYATLSRPWQQAIESFTFRHLRISNEDIPKFSTLVSGSRRQAVCFLGFTIRIPAYVAGPGTSEQEWQQSSNEILTSSFVSLFALLKSWEDDGVYRALTLSVMVPMQDEADLPADISDQGFPQRVVGLCASTNLPALSNVQEIYVSSERRRPLALAVGPILAKSLPNLRFANWLLEDDHEMPAFIRSENRLAFAQALASVHFPSCTSIAIDAHTGRQTNPNDSHEPIKPPGATYDPFSTSIRTLSLTLTKVRVMASIDPTLLWPSPHEPSPEIPIWPSLRTLQIDFSRIAPSGESYFVNIDAPHRVNPTTMNPFFAALAKAVRNMPALETLSFACKLGDMCEFRINYYLPSWGLNQHSRRVVYEVGSDCEIPKEVIEGLRYAGKERYGGDVVEEFGPVWCECDGGGTDEMSE